MELRNRLRDETKIAHQQLDRCLGRLGVFESFSNYAVYLSGLHQLYSFYGSEVDWASDRAGIACSVADLKQAIENDLTHNVLPPVDVDSCESELQNPANCWAAAYVLEGSAMGARYMLKQVQASPLVASCEIKITYLTKLASDSYERWPKLVAALESADCDANYAVDAAKKVFQTAANIFEKSIERHSRCQKLLH